MNRMMHLVAMTAAALALSACSRSSVKEATASIESESRLQRGTHGEVVVTIDAETQKRMGLHVAVLSAVEVSPELKAFGRVLDAAPLADLAVELSKAELALDASQAEFERIKLLREQSNASEKTFQAARNAYQLNKTAVSAAWQRIRNNWGEKLAEMTGPMVVPVGAKRKWDAVLSDLVNGRNMLARVELNAGDRLERPPSSARLAWLGEAQVPVQVAYFDTARTVDPQTQGRAWFFLIQTNHFDLAPGMALTAFVDTGGAAAAGVEVPRSAVIRLTGTTWIYLQTEEDSFERREVKLDRPLDDGWFVSEGLQPGEKVVTIGAQQLLSEELKGQGGEE